MLPLVTASKAFVVSGFQVVTMATEVKSFKDLTASACDITASREVQVEWLFGEVGGGLSLWYAGAADHG